MKVLNLYAGIGGNRKLWTKENTGVDIEVTAVELDPNIAKIYQDFFPDDKVIVGDAHQYLLEHYKEFDFIWSSPPCPSHSRLNTFNVSNGIKKLEYPSMILYEEILLMQHWCKKKYVIENVIPYYKPLIPGQTAGRHLWWANFYIKPYNSKKLPHKESEVGYLQEFLGFNLKKYSGIDKRKALRNCVEPELGLHIFKSMNNQELKLAI